MAYVSTSNFDMYTSKAALLVQNVEEYSIIMKFANFLEGIFFIQISGIFIYLTCK